MFNLARAAVRRTPPPSAYLRLVSSVTTTTTSNTLAMPAASPRPVKHKKKTTSDATTPPSNMLPFERRPQKGRQNPDGQMISTSSADAYDVAAICKILQRLGLLENEGSPSSSKAGGAVNLLGESIYLQKWTFTRADGQVEQGEIFIFQGGSFVTWGFSPEGAEGFLRTVIRGGGFEWVEKGRYEQAEQEMLSYWIDSAPGSSTRMQGDNVLLSAAPGSSRHIDTEPGSDLLARLALSCGLSRVTKLGSSEEQFEIYASGVAGIAKALESGSEGVLYSSRFEWYLH